MTRLLLIQIVVFSICCICCSCKSKYQFAKVCDYAIYNDSIYILILREEGINKASRNEHSAAYEPTRRVFGVVHSSIKNGVATKLHLDSKTVITSGQLLNTDSFFLCSTNLCATRLDAASIFVFDVLNKNYTKTLKSDHIHAGVGKKYLIGCGKTPWIFDTNSRQTLYANEGAKLLNKLCNQSISRHNQRFAVSDDFKLLALQDRSNGLNGVEVVPIFSPDSVKRVNFEDATMTLCNVTGMKDNFSIMMTAIGPGHRQYVLFFDLNGKELHRLQLEGQPVSDANGKLVIAVAVADTVQIQNNYIAMKLWHLDDKTESNLILNISDIMKIISGN